MADLLKPLDNASGGAEDQETMTLDSPSTTSNQLSPLSSEDTATAITPEQQQNINTVNQTQNNLTAMQAEQAPISPISALGGSQQDTKPKRSRYAPSIIEPSVAPKNVQKTDTKQKDVKPIVNEDIQAQADQIYEAQKNNFIEQSRATQQSSIDALKQTLSQSGYNSSGAKNAMMAIYSSSINSNMINGLQQLALSKMTSDQALMQGELNFQRTQEQQSKRDAFAYNMSMFEELNGYPDQQIEFAKMQAQLDPENEYWAQFNDPDFAKNWPKWNSEAYQAKDAERIDSGLNFIGENVIRDLTNQQDYFQDWASIRFTDQQLLKSNTDAWSTSSPSEVDKYLAKLGYTREDASDFKVMQDAYKLMEYEKAVQRKIADDIATNTEGFLASLNLGGLDEMEKQLIKDNASLIASVMGDQEFSIDGISGMLSGDIETSDFGHMYVDWFGDAYGQGYTKEMLIQRVQSDPDSEEGERALNNLRLDALWGAYLGSAPKENRMSRSEFVNNEAIQNILGSDTTNDIYTNTKAKNLIEQELGENGSFAVWGEIKNLGGDNFLADVQRGGMDAFHAISELKSYQVTELMKSDVWNDKIKPNLIESGAIPVLSGDTINYQDNMYYKKDDGSFDVSPIVMDENGNLFYVENDRLKNTKYKTYVPLDVEGVSSAQKIRVLGENERTPYVQWYNRNRSALPEANSLQEIIALYNHYLWHTAQQ